VDASESLPVQNSEHHVIAVEVHSYGLSCLMNNIFLPQVASVIPPFPSHALYSYQQEFLFLRDSQAVAAANNKSCIRIVKLP
jgi:hypothetical protein